MEKLYMKVREELENWEILNPKSPSFEECLGEGKRLGYKEYRFEVCPRLEWYGILLLDGFWDIWVSKLYEEELISLWYKEHFLPPQYREVYVSDVSVEFALENKEKRVLITELPWKHKYVCVENGHETDFKDWKGYFITTWKYIAEIPKKEQVKEMTLSEVEKELWYPIKIIK